MFDELDLGHDEQDRGDKGKHRRGRKRGGRSGGGRGKTALALLLALVLLGGIGGGAFYGFDRVQSYFVTPDYDGAGTEEVTIQIPQGAFLADMAVALYDAGVIKSTKAFIEAAEKNSRSRNIQSGTYKLRKQMSGELALAAMLDPASRIVNGITIPEGRTAKSIFKLLSDKTDIPVKEFEAAAKDPEKLGVPDWWFKRDDGKKSKKSIEGFLFPDTYEIPPNATAETILGQMVDHFLSVTGEMEFADRVQKDRKISPYEALIVASLAQAEAGNAEDLGKIARVAYNRAYSGNFPCNCLEFDVSVNYYWELTGKKTKSSKEMRREEIRDPKNPYSTHSHPGLTPTPINNPGKQALEGAMDPPKGDWLFFVAIDKEGRSAFAETNAEHERNVAKAKENGIL
ncbi:MULTISPECIES: endolytic transglycosylase MltG [Micromonospora]|uniref:Endolytic murein transglycosylase n=1 Tax=Micromonospora maris TaxID=1003110 RepID=A0A9X0LGE6_9ACTN|nr:MULTISPECIES: endolytic transglycosylase MltG [Micromonospora]AEB44083.1 aminodeoxychorismate lyase [Micromonospora maris AB-18-032]KUJ49305.1 aminodeoxychorismate lyase [Micromonospora maris]RUL91253.1 endolytic transglycosylase MltG [Verrucosispora sp. FIM060022]